MSNAAPDLSSAANGAAPIPTPQDSRRERTLVLLDQLNAQGLDDRTIAQRSGIRARTIQLWRRGTTAPSEALARLVENLHTSLVA